MDVNELMKLERPLTDEEMAFMESELLRTVDELKTEVGRITKDLDAKDPIVAKLRAGPTNIERTVREALACREEASADPYKPTLPPPVYTWEKLPAYEWINSFSRVIGILLAVLPRKLHVHAHNLAGQAMLISNCIALGYRDSAPGEEVTKEEVRAYRVIGYHATFTTMEMLEELTKITALGRSDVAKGMSLIGQIREQFEKGLDELDDVKRIGPMVMH